MFVYVCVYLMSKALFLFFIIKVVKSPYDLFSTVKEAASEKCVTSTLSMRNCQKGFGASRWEENSKVGLVLGSPRGAPSWKALA